MSMSLCTIPNVLSAFRLASVPVLLALAWGDYEKVFLVLLVCALLTDHMFQKHTLAPTARPDNCGNLAAGNLHVQIVQHNLIAKGFPDLSQRYHSFSRKILHARSPTEESRSGSNPKPGSGPMT